MEWGSVKSSRCLESLENKTSEEVGFGVRVVLIDGQRFPRIALHDIHLPFDFPRRRLRTR